VNLQVVDSEPVIDADELPARPDESAAVPGSEPPASTANGGDPVTMSRVDGDSTDEIEVGIHGDAVAEHPPPDEQNQPTSSTQLSSTSGTRSEDIQRQVEDALGAARQALAERDYGVAQQALHRVSSLSLLEHQRQRVEQMRALARCVEEFDEAVGRRMAGLAALSEIKISDTFIVSVIDVGPGWIQIRDSGESKKFGRDDLPIWLSAAMGAEQLGAENPETQLRRAAYVALDPKSISMLVERARSRIRELAAEIPEARLVLAALEDETSSVAD
jgi:hypothetical protein